MAKSKTLADKWSQATEDQSLSPGDRIRLFWEISFQANDIRINGSETAFEKIKNEIAELCRSSDSSDSKKIRIHNNQVSQYLRLCNLYEDEISKLAEDADRPPVESPDDQRIRFGYKSRMSISHALLLATVTKRARRKKLLNEAIAEHWSIDILADKSKNDRDGSITRSVKSTGEKLVRHRKIINSLSKSAAELLELLAELEDDLLVQTISQSDRRNRADTLEKLKNLVSAFELIRKKMPASKLAAKCAANSLERFINQK